MKEKREFPQGLLVIIIIAIVAVIYIGINVYSVNHPSTTLTIYDNNNDKITEYSGKHIKIISYRGGSYLVFKDGNSTYYYSDCSMTIELD